MGFILNTVELSRRPGAERDFSLSVEAPGDFEVGLVSVPENSLIDITGRMESVVEGVYVSGEIAATLAGECSRCLDRFEIDTRESFAELYVYELSDDELAVVGDLLDLEPVVRDALFVDIAINVLCREDCKGLCVQCGANLNDDPEHQHDDAVDPRWSALESLKGKDEF